MCTVQLYLSIADLGSSLNYFLSPYIAQDVARAAPGCVAQGLMLQFFNLSSFLWTSTFATHLHQLIWKTNTNAEVRPPSCCASGLPTALRASGVPTALRAQKYERVYIAVS